MKPYKSPYKDHGSRHAPGGSDPIPGLGANMPWASVSNLGFVLASSTSQSHVDFDTSGSATGGSSGDSQLTVGSIASGVFGININAAGVYIVSLAAGAVVTSAPAAGAACIANYYTPGGNNGFHPLIFTGSAAFWQQVGGTFYNSNQSQVAIANLDPSFVTFPVGVGGSVAQNSGVSSTGSAVLTIIQISAVTDPNYEF